MNNVRFAAAFCALSVGAIACAKTPAVETAPSTNTGIITTGGGNSPTSWSGNISAVVESNSDVRQSSRGNGYGTAQMTAGPTASSTRVSLNYSSGGSTDRYLNWAILPGRCGSGSLPIIAINNFPELQVGGDGRAQVTAELPFELPARGDYHVNVYHERGQTLDQVIACGNLRPSGGR